MSRTEESRASLRMKGQARRSSSKPIITPVTPAAMAAYKEHLVELSESQPVELNLFSIAELFDASLDQGLAYAATEWMSGVERGTLPICLCCDTQWLSFGDIPPAGFAVLAPYTKVGATICSGICEDCFYQPNLLYRLLLGPDIYCQIISPAPAGCSDGQAQPTSRGQHQTRRGSYGPYIRSYA
jgi:hypothetical protein